MTAYRHRIEDWQFFVLYLGLIIVAAGVGYIVLDAVDQTVLEVPLVSLALGGAAGGAIIGMSYVETLECFYRPYGVGIMIFLAVSIVLISSKTFFGGVAVGMAVGLIVTLVIGEVNRVIRSST
ncbi:hypothetical protein [Halorhabdus salina]|uniref:hypothetical protein n=1 Tax=Halorhabdus salina TaxID=2750670 RepID=UPI0015EF890B|nr:hypothetical protein [Halorhabdus salina]